MKTINYNKQAKDFLKTTNTDFKAEFLKYGKHFEGDQDDRDIYSITLKRGDREYVFNFGQSVNCSMECKPVTPYAKEASKGKRLMGEDKRNALLKVSLSYHSFMNNDFVKNKNFKEPTAYDVLACLQKYDVGSFEDFCSEFGYDTDSMKAKKIYDAVLEEYKNVCILWNEEEIGLLQKIQ